MYRSDEERRLQQSAVEEGMEEVEGDSREAAVQGRMIDEWNAISNVMQEEVREKYEVIKELCGELCG